MYWSMCAAGRTDRAEMGGEVLRSVLVICHVDVEIAELIWE